MKTFPFEHATVRGEPLPSNLHGIDIITYFAMCYIYERHKNGNISREQGSVLKRKVVDAYEYTNRFPMKYEGMWKRIEEAATNYSLNPSIEKADAFYAAVYNLPNDWRLKR